MFCKSKCFYPSYCEENTNLTTLDHKKNGYMFFLRKGCISPSTTYPLQDRSWHKTGRLREQNALHVLEEQRYLFRGRMVLSSLAQKRTTQVISITLHSTLKITAMPIGDSRKAPGSNASWLGGRKGQVYDTPHHFHLRSKGVCVFSSLNERLVRKHILIQCCPFKT